MIATRGIGPGVTLATFGYGPFIISALGEAVIGLVAAVIGINAVLQAPVQLSSWEIASAALDANLSVVEMLLESGLVEDAASVEDALRASMDLAAGLKDDGFDVG